MPPQEVLRFFLAFDRLLLITTDPLFPPCLSSLFARAGLRRIVIKKHHFSICRQKTEMHAYAGFYKFVQERVFGDTLGGLVFFQARMHACG